MKSIVQQFSSPAIPSLPVSLLFSVEGHESDGLRFVGADYWAIDAMVGIEFVQADDGEANKLNNAKAALTLSPSSTVLPECAHPTNGFQHPVQQ